MNYQSVMTAVLVIEKAIENELESDNPDYGLIHGMERSQNIMETNIEDY